MRQTLRNIRGTSLDIDWTFSLAQTFKTHALNIEEHLGTFEDIEEDHWTFLVLRTFQSRTLKNNALNIECSTVVLYLSEGTAQSVKIANAEFLVTNFGFD